MFGLKLWFNVWGLSKIPLRKDFWWFLSGKIDSTPISWILTSQVLKIPPKCVEPIEVWYESLLINCYITLFMRCRLGPNMNWICIYDSYGELYSWNQGGLLEWSPKLAKAAKRLIGRLHSIYIVQSSNPPRCLLYMAHLPVSKSISSPHIITMTWHRKKTTFLGLFVAWNAYGLETCRSLNVRASKCVTDSSVSGPSSGCCGVMFDACTGIGSEKHKKIDVSKQ